MIKIVRGTFGYLKGGTVVGITEKDEPISIDPARERELIELGIAEKVDCAEGEVTEISKEYLKSLSMPQLREFAEQFGLKCKVGTGKSDFIQEIIDCTDKASEESEEADESEEEAPELDPEKAVQ